MLCGIVLEYELCHLETQLGTQNWYWSVRIKFEIRITLASVLKTSAKIFRNFSSCTQQAVCPAIYILLSGHSSVIWTTTAFPGCPTQNFFYAFLGKKILLIFATLTTLNSIFGPLFMEIFVANIALWHTGMDKNHILHVSNSNDVVGKSSPEPERRHPRIV